MAMTTKGKKQTTGAVSHTSTMTVSARRWTVGTMVAISVLLAALLTALLQLLVFKTGRPLKWDLTSSGINSLSAGTRNVLASLEDEKIHLTSLYLETDIESAAQKKYRQAVDDLLRLYQVENPSKVERAWINPLKDQVKLGQLLERVRELPDFKKDAEAYVAAIKRFEDDIFKPFAAALQGFVDELSAIDQSATLAGGGPGSTGLTRALKSWLEAGNRVAQDVQSIMDQKLPKYSAATDRILSFYEPVGGKMEIVIGSMADQLLQSEEWSEPAKQVLAKMKTDLRPWVDKLKSEQETIQNLPALAIDELERALQQNNVVVVESKDGAKALSFEELWPPLREGDFADPNDFEKRRFAGEGAITPTILQLVQREKSAVVFVHFGGERLFGAGGFGPNARGGAMTAMKAELEKLNYQVAEWDVKQTQEKPKLDPVPKRTLYIVLRPAPEMGPQGLPSGPGMGPTQREAVLGAIKESGRAIFLTGWMTFGPKYEYHDFLSKEWSIDVEGQSLVVTAIPTGPGVWGLSQNFAMLSTVVFRDHALTEGLEFLQNECIFPLTTIINPAKEKPEGVTISELASTPASEDIWAVKDPPSFVDRYRDEQKTRRATDDPAGPFAVALAAEKGEGKIVVLAVGEPFLHDNLAVENVLVMGPGGLQVRRRAPGNFAFFTNILHYLDDTLQWLNIGSPVDTSRIEIAQKDLNLWRVLSIGVFPALAILAGGFTWYVRRR